MTVTIETRRLLLRPFAPADAAAVEGYVAQWEIARMTTRIPHPYPEGAAAAWIAGQEATRQEGSAYSFAVALPGNDKLGDKDGPIGAVSLRRSEPGHWEPGHWEPGHWEPVHWELGYWLAPGHWGRGLATEAAQAMVVYGFEKLGAEALTSGHFADNPASGRVLEKAGFRANVIARQWSQARQAFVDAKWFLLTRERWQRARAATQTRPGGRRS